MPYPAPASVALPRERPLAPESDDRTPPPLVNQRSPGGVAAGSARAAR
jgi:hypothetical protein